MMRTFSVQHLPTPIGPQSITSGPIPSSTPTAYSPAALELMSFKKGIKREITAYPSLKDERYFDGFKRSLFIVAKTHECSDVLDPNYTPGSEPEEQELFEAKQTFMFSVFNTNLQTDMGKTIVRRHLASTDAQAVWKELSEHMNRSGAPADCWLQCMIHASYILNHLSCEALAGDVPLGMLYGVSPDISIILLYTFYQPVFMPPTTNLTPLLVRKELHDGLALENMLVIPSPTYSLMMTPRKSSTDLLSDPQILPIPTGVWYQMEGSSQTPKPIIFVRSRQDDSQSATKPMAEYNPDDLIGRTFLLPKNEQGERLRATIKRKVVETSKLLDNQHDNAIDKINFQLVVGQGRAEDIMSYVHILDPLDQQEQQEDLYKFRAITGHQGPLSPQDENYKGSKYNVMVERETGEITDEPLSLIAADDPVTCAIYAKKHDLLHLDGWKRLKHIAKNQKQLTRAINQSKIRQVRRSAKNQLFGFLIPKDNKQALQLDEQNGNSKWYDATKLEMDQINE